MIRARLLALFLLALSTGALGHDFYDAACCSDRDCHPVRGEPAPGGFRFFDDGKVFFVKDDDTRPSKDGRYHLCRYPGSDTPICAYAPRAGT